MAKERLERMADGRVRYMKKPWRDGTRAVVLTPLDLIARLCATVPPPGVHMIRFHRVFAGHAADRADVVPHPELDAESSVAPTKDAVARRARWWHGWKASRSLPVGCAPRAG